MHEIKPKKCCPCGSYDCQIPMPINGKLRGIDYCIADIVAALTAANISTIASCCGHGGDNTTSILLGDGREIIIKNVTRFWEEDKSSLHT